MSFVVESKPKMVKSIGGLEVTKEFDEFVFEIAKYRMISLDRGQWNDDDLDGMFEYMKEAIVSNTFFKLLEELDEVTRPPVRD